MSRGLQKILRNFEVKKAILFGSYDKNNPNPKSDIDLVIDSQGKEAILDYQVLKRNKEQNKTLVKIFLQTGRHHQIRVQFAYHQHPLCGDQRYGKQDKTQIALYAYQLELIHPTTKEKLTFKKLPARIDHWTQFTVSSDVQ